MGPATTPDELLESLHIDRRHLGDLVHELTSWISQTVETIAARRGGGDQVFPSVDFSELVAGNVSAAELHQISSHGCVVVRGTFSTSQAEAWDAELAAYLDRNDFERRLVEKYPNLAACSKIWPIYWSRPQIEARQHPNMVAVRRFVNSFWKHRSRGVEWFDPEHDIGYADRIRRRQPGVEAAGLAPHNDAPSALGWRLPENQHVFGGLLQHGLGGYDPWDAAHRTAPDPSSNVVSSVFRTFQGWTALSRMEPADGVLHVVPVLPAVGYRLVRGLAGELGLLGTEPEAAPARDRGDELLARALVAIPTVEPGDTVWWHSDLFHSVGAATNDTRWGNVMYIGAAPVCPRNDAYRPSMYPRFLAGVSPIDFPDDRFEADFGSRATTADLNLTGRAQFGID
jgi:hypothetical protein